MTTQLTHVNICRLVDPNGYPITLSVTPDDSLSLLEDEVYLNGELVAYLGQKTELESGKQWHPANKGTRWGVSSDGAVDLVSYPISDEATKLGLKHGLMFDSKEAAEKAFIRQHRYNRLYKLAEELNGGWEPNWSDQKEQKWGIYEMDGIYCCSPRNQLAGVCEIYFRSEKTAKEAIRLITECNALLDSEETKS